MKNEVVEKIIQNIEKVIYGKRGVIEKIIICLLSNGHVLIEDMPGVGKTTLVHTLAKSINCDFNRIQFTPDLLPSDITGISIFNQKIGEFEVKFGPIMSQIILADEINRTSPKTQSSLLEVMEEHQVTIDGITYKLKEPFMVLATQNPIEYEGTFSLPEAQLDRFMMRIKIGYPDEEYELMMLKTYKEKNPIEEIKPVCEPSDIIALRDMTKKIYVDEKIERYILAIIKATREREEIILGASPRASLSLLKCCQGRALLLNREYVTPDDVKTLVYSVLGHRIILKPEYRIKGIKTEDIIEKIVSSISVPGVGRYV